MKPNNRSGKRGSAYFDGFLKAKGQDFLLSERQDALARKVPLLIKDIAYGNVEINKYGRFFTQFFVCDIVYPELYKLYMAKLVHYNAVKEFIDNHGGDDLLNSVLIEDGDQVAAYQIALEGFQSMINSGGNLSYIPIMGNKLNRYRFKL